MRANTLGRWGMTVLFLAPPLFSFLMLKYVPMFQSLSNSLFMYDFVHPPGKFIGIDNYLRALDSELFWRQFYNTVILFVLGIALGFWVPILQALLLNEIRKGQGLLRYLYVLPAGIPGISALAIWKYIWDPQAGLANELTEFLRLGSFDWLYDPNLVKFALRFPAILGGGLGVLIYMVAISNVPDEQYEAARVDGANRWTMLWKITLPNMMYMIKIQFVLAMTTSLLAFDDVFVLTQGGPDNASTTLIMGLYQKGFQELNFGQAMAVSVIVFIATLIFTYIQMRSLREK